MLTKVPPGVHVTVEACVTVVDVHQRISPGGYPLFLRFAGNKVTQKDFGGFRLFRIIARFSKHDFWNLGEIWDRNR